MKFNPTNYPTVMPVGTDTVLLRQSSTGNIKSALVSTLANAASPLQVVDSIAALKALPTDGVSDGAITEITGYSEAGGGGEGQFYYDSTSSEADDGGMIIAPDDGSGRWKRLYGDRLMVEWFGAVGGATDDTSAFQLAVNAAMAFDLPLSLMKREYTCGGLTVNSSISIYGNGATINLTGSDPVDLQWLEFTASFTGFYIDNLTIIGDGVLASKQIGFGPTTSSVVVTNARIYNVNIRDVVVAIDASAMVDCEIFGGTIGPVVGILSGQGYGVAFGTNSSQCSIIGTRFYRCTRHSLYAGDCESLSVIGVKIIEHGYGQTPTSGSGMAISRGNNTTISGCIFRDCVSHPMEISDDSGVTGVLSSVSVSGCSFYGCPKAILIGVTGAVSSDSNVIGVSITGCSFYIPATNDGVITIYAADTVTISGNAFNFITNVTGQNGIVIDDPVTDYPKNIFITGNRATLSGSGVIRCFVYLDTGVCSSTSAASVKINGNSVGGGELFVEAAAVQNGNIVTDTLDEQAITGATPYVSAYNRFGITQGGATNVTDFLGSYEGQRISILFRDGNSTIVNGAGMFLAGGANFVAGANDQLVLERTGSAWREISRSVN
jgi:hypothetical protein